MSPGVKFKDAELIGVPTIVVVGRGLADGVVEVKDRATGERDRRRGRRRGRPSVSARRLTPRSDARFGRLGGLVDDDHRRREPGEHEPASDDRDRNVRHGAERRGRGRPGQLGPDPGAADAVADDAQQHGQTDEVAGDGEGDGERGRAGVDVGVVTL